jgi:hypothetical protein
MQLQYEFYERKHESHKSKLVLFVLILVQFVCLSNIFNQIFKSRQVI